MKGVLLFGLIVTHCTLAKRVLAKRTAHSLEAIELERGPKNDGNVPKEIADPPEVKSCKANIKTRMSQTSEEEKNVLNELFVPLVVGRFGVGMDVTDERRPYNDLTFLNAWKVTETPELKAYSKYKVELDHNRSSKTSAAHNWLMQSLDFAHENILQPVLSLFGHAPAARGDDYWVDTCRNDVQQMARNHKMTGENEYLFFKGSKPDSLLRHMCAPREGTDVNKDPYKANYGYGVYLCDASDKMDQYTGEGFKEIKDWLGTEHEDIQKLQGQIENSTHHHQDIFLAGVQRVYMGKHIEVQLDYQSCVKAGEGADKRRIMFHYRDPWNSSQEDISIYEDSLNSTREPPFEDWDSIKVMTTTFNPEYSENIRPGTALSPNRHNEYIVPRQDQAAIQYIVAYARKWDAKNPAKQLNCTSRTGEEIPRPPRQPRKPCAPCSEDWKYEGKRGRLQPGEVDQLPTCAKKK